MAYTGERTYSTAHVTGATVCLKAKHTRWRRDATGVGPASAMVLIRI